MSFPEAFDPSSVEYPEVIGVIRDAAARQDLNGCTVGDVKLFCGTAPPLTELNAHAEDPALQVMLFTHCGAPNEDDPRYTVCVDRFDTKGRLDTVWTGAFGSGLEYGPDTDVETLEAVYSYLSLLLGVTTFSAEAAELSVAAATHTEPLPVPVATADKPQETCCREELSESDANGSLLELDDAGEEDDDFVMPYARREVVTRPSSRRDSRRPRLTGYHTAA